jgi:HSP20 family molecular chaperone IbpA
MIRNRRHPFGALWDELGQVQDEFTKWFGRAARSPSAPTLSVWEDEVAVYAEADLPGLDPAKIEVTVTDGNQLTVARSARSGSSSAPSPCRPWSTPTGSRRSTSTGSCG